MQIKRGEIWLVDFGNKDSIKGSVQYGIRPALIIGNQIGLDHSEIAIVAPITSSMEKAKLPTHVYIDSAQGLKKNSIVLLEQPQTVSFEQMINKIGWIGMVKESEVNMGIMISLGLQ